MAKVQAGAANIVSLLMNENSIHIQICVCHTELKLMKGSKNTFKNQSRCWKSESFKPHYRRFHTLLKPILPGVQSDHRKTKYG